MGRWYPCNPRCAGTSSSHQQCLSTRLGCCFNREGTTAITHLDPKRALITQHGTHSCQFCVQLPDVFLKQVCRNGVTMRNHDSALFGTCIPPCRRRRQRSNLFWARANGSHGEVYMMCYILLILSVPSISSLSLSLSLRGFESLFPSVRF
jgi:hypothetical protein